MTTPLDIITQALKEVGALGQGQTAASVDVNDAFLKLNWMLSQWQRKRYLVYHLVELSFVCTGAQSYSIGQGGNFSYSAGDFNSDFNNDFSGGGGALAATNRPAKIESAFVRQLSGMVDYPLTMINSKEDYDHIALKTLSSWPSHLYYDAAWPIGWLYPWPVPLANIYELHITIVAQLSQFNSLTQPISLPPEYFAAIFYNLAVRLYPSYTTQPNPITIAMAKDALNVLRMSNSRIANLRMPIDLVRPGVYNPYSDQVR